MKKILLGLSILASLSFSAEYICSGLYDAGNFQKSGDCKKGGTKKYEKVCERIGRAMQNEAGQKVQPRFSEFVPTSQRSG